MIKSQLQNTSFMLTLTCTIKLYNRTCEKLGEKLFKKISKFSEITLPIVQLLILSEYFYNVTSTTLISYT